MQFLNKFDKNIPKIYFNYLQTVNNKTVWYKLARNEFPYFPDENRVQINRCHGTLKIGIMEMDN